MCRWRLAHQRWQQRLAYTGTGSTGACPGHNGHNTGSSSEYVLDLGGAAGTGLQNGWAWCDKCQMLWWGGNTEGRCPSDNGSHTDVGSGNYLLEFASVAASAPASAASIASISPTCSASPNLCSTPVNGSSTALPISNSGSSGSGGTLSPGAIAGIALPVAILCLIAAVAITIVCTKRKRESGGQQWIKRYALGGIHNQTTKAMPVVERVEAGGRMVAHAELE